jgi:hypothetical protein
VDLAAIVGRVLCGGRMKVYLVTDDPGSGANPDIYGIFSTRELAQAWIDRQHQRQTDDQKRRGVNVWLSDYVIHEMPLNDVKDRLA